MKTIKKKLRDLTMKEYISWKDKNCSHWSCRRCPFRTVKCQWVEDYCWINNKNIYSDEFLDKEVKIEVEGEMSKLTDEEKIILKNIDKQFKYIARDSEGILGLYVDKPLKYNFSWYSGSNYKSFAFTNLFKFIKWEDEDPCSIEDLLKGN